MGQAEDTQKYWICTCSPEGPVSVTSADRGRQMEAVTDWLRGNMPERLGSSDAADATDVADAVIGVCRDYVTISALVRDVNEKDHR